MQRALVMFLMMFSLLMPRLAWGLGSDHPTGKPVEGSHWPAGLAAIVNADNRVHGYFVNSADVFFFSGDAAALNGFLGRCVALPKTKVRVTLHDGKPEVKSPWDKQPRVVAADWKLTAAPFDEKGERLEGGEYVARVDVWVGGEVRRADIRIPADAKVDAGLEVARVPAAVPASQPATAARSAYRLTRQTVAGLTPMQFVFIIVTPEGYPWVADASKLHWMIENAVPAGATLEWNPGCKRIGGEPLDTAAELDALKAFCAGRNVSLVPVPAG